MVTHNITIQSLTG